VGKFHLPQVGSFALPLTPASLSSSLSRTGSGESSPHYTSRSSVTEILSRCA